MSAIPTPRTDAATDRVYNEDTPGKWMPFVEPEFARELERELAQCKAFAAIAKATQPNTMTPEQTLQELQRWLRAGVVISGTPDVNLLGDDFTSLTANCAAVTDPAFACVDLRVNPAPYRDEQP